MNPAQHLLIIRSKDFASLLWREVTRIDHFINSISQLFIQFEPTAFNGTVGKCVSDDEPIAENEVTIRRKKTLAKQG